jgi:hypothetical protein
MKMSMLFSEGINMPNKIDDLFTYCFMSFTIVILFNLANDKYNKMHLIKTPLSNEIHQYDLIFLNELFSMSSKYSNIKKTHN